jgi:hypothetical protein
MTLPWLPFAQVTPVTPGSSPDDQLDDIRPPFFYLHPWFWLWIALGLIATAAILSLFWYLFRPHQQLSAKRSSKRPVRCFRKKMRCPMRSWSRK